MICGFVLAKKGEKISKSKSNAALLPPALIANILLMLSDIGS